MQRRIVLMLCVGIAFVGTEDDWEDFICFGKPTDAVIAHPTECQFFFLCDGGVGRQKQCPPNLFFDPVKLECDPDYRCDHPNATKVPPYTDTTTSSNLPTSEPPTTATNRPIQCPPNDTANVTMLENPNHRSEYYLCYYGKARRFECPRRYEFSATDKACIPAQQSASNVGQYASVLFVCKF